MHDTGPPDCPLCHPAAGRVRRETAHALALLDGFPVTPGHTLIVPRRHVASLFDLPEAERAAVWALVAEVRAVLVAEFGPDGFTVGLNDGPAAGQTVPHAHVHVIPRRTGDVPDPRGGVRWVLPERAAYWEGA
jgi:diadenosine tetraphosphate (Ap4A) HIT family hydrolase